MNEKDLELIDRYLTGNMTDEDRELWQERIADEEFRNALASSSEIQQAVRFEGREDLRKLLLEWDNQPAIRRRSRMYFWASTAAALLILVLVYLFTRPGSSPAYIASNYVEPYPNLVAPLQKGEAGSPDEYAEAFHLYETGYYGKAESAFSALDPEDEAVQFYSALTVFLDDREEEAIPRLESISYNSDHKFNIPAKWYLGLAFLMSGEEDKGLQQIQFVAGTDTPLAREAQELLHKIQ